MLMLMTIWHTNSGATLPDSQWDWSCRTTSIFLLLVTNFMSLVNGSSLVLTDSGGIQEETTFLGKNCLTLREETERPITVTEGTNKVIGVNKEKIINEINNSLESNILNETMIKYWDGKTSDRIYEILFG